MNILGVDSDTKTVGMAYMENGELRECVILEKPHPQMVHASMELDWTPDYVVMEVPEVTAAWTRRGVDANNLVTLARAAGITATLLSAWFGGQTLFVLPKDWKGQQSKAKHHVKIAARHGFVFEAHDKGVKILETSVPAYRYPSAGRVKASDWSHLIDAVGIAEWGTAKCERLEYLSSFSPPL